MKSYIKLYGPPISKGINALRKIAIDFPEVCVMDTALEANLGFSSYAVGSGGSQDSVSMVMTYFGDDVPEERCNTIISKSGESVGKYDFYFEWFKKPTMDQLEDSISQIDEALGPTGVKYTITSK